MSRPTITPVLFLTFISVLCCNQSKADPFLIEDEIMMDLELQPSFPIEKDFIGTFPIQINHRQQKNLRKTQIVPTKLPIKNDNEDEVLYDGPGGRIFFAQVISLLAQGLGNILVGPTTTTTTTYTSYFTCTISTTACSGRRRRGILIEEDIKESFITTKANTRKSVFNTSTSSGIQKNNHTSSVSRSKQNSTLKTRFVMGSPNKKKNVSPSSVQQDERTKSNTMKSGSKSPSSSGMKRNNKTSLVSRSKQSPTLKTRFVMGSPNKKKIVSPSSVQKIDKTAMPNATKVIDNDRPYASTTATYSNKTIVASIPNLASSIADQLAPLSLKDLLAVSSSNSLVRHRLNLLISSAHQNGLLPQQLGVNPDDDDGQLNEENQQLLLEGLGRAVTVTSFVVTWKTTTSTPSCSRASGFNQC